MTEHFVLESVTTILVVVIPTLIATFGTKRILNSLQIKKERFSLEKDHLDFKHKIQKNCEIALVGVLNNVLAFRNTIRQNYYTNWELKSNGKISHSVIIPDGEENLPENLLSDAKNKFFINRLELNAEAWKFYSIISIYYKSEKIKQTYDDFFEKEDYMQTLVSLLTSTTKTEDLSKYNVMLKHKTLELRQKASDLLELIANTPFEKYSR